MNEKINKLNLGCGENIKDGYINLEFRQIDNIDVVHDLNNYPWPFENNSFNEIIAYNVIEHLDNFILAMEEIHRISKDNALIKKYEKLKGIFLIGYDGAVKAHSKDSSLLLNLYNTIDNMPIRKKEIKNFKSIC